MRPAFESLQKTASDVLAEVDAANSRRTAESLAIKVASMPRSELGDLMIKIAEELRTQTTVEPTFADLEVWMRSHR